MISDKKRVTIQKPNFSDGSQFSKLKSNLNLKRRKKSSKKKPKIKFGSKNENKFTPAQKKLIISLIIITVVGLIVVTSKVSNLLESFFTNYPQIIKMLADLPLWLAISSIVVSIILIFTIFVWSYLRIQRDRRFVITCFILILIVFPLVSIFVLNPSYPTVQFNSSEYVIGKDTSLNFTVLDKKSLNMYSEFSIFINGDEIHTGKFNEQDISIEIPYEYVQSLIPGEKYLITFNTRNRFGTSINQKHFMQTFNDQPKILSKAANFTTFEVGDPNANIQWEIQDSSVLNSHFEISIERYTGEESFIYTKSENWSEDIIEQSLSALSIGTYSANILFYDGIGGEVSSNTQFRILEDLAPVIEGPTKINLHVNESCNILFGIDDFQFPKGQYELHFEADIVSSGNYTAGADISYYIDTKLYEEGDYTGRLTLDSPSGEVFHAFQVIIRENFDPIIQSVKIYEVDDAKPPLIIRDNSDSIIHLVKIKKDIINNITVLVEIQDFQWGSAADVSIWQGNRRITSGHIAPDIIASFNTGKSIQIMLEFYREDLLAPGSEFEIRVYDGFGGLAIYKLQLEITPSVEKKSPNSQNILISILFGLMTVASISTGILSGIFQRRRNRRDKHATTSSSPNSPRISAQTKAILICIFLTLLPNFFGIGLGLEEDSKILDIQLGCRYAQNSGYVGEYNNTYYIHVFDSLTVNWSTGHNGMNILRIRRASDDIEITSYRQHYLNATQNQVDFVLDPENNQIIPYILNELYYVEISLFPDDTQIDPSVSDL